MLTLASMMTGLGICCGLGITICLGCSCNWSFGCSGGGGIFGGGGVLILISGGGVVGTINSVISKWRSITCLAVMPTASTTPRIVRLTRQLVMNPIDRPSGSGNRPKLVRPGEYVVGMSSNLA